ncbi:MAG: hypothetical protein RIC14_11325 [Filomicrobium sp.]
MADDTDAVNNVVRLYRRGDTMDSGHPVLPLEEDARLGSVAAEELRQALVRQIEAASLRWSRDGALVAPGELPKPSDSLVASASEACAKVALEEAIRAVFWECGGPIPKADMPLRLVRLQEDINASLRKVLKDLGYV